MPRPRSRPESYLSKVLRERPGLWNVEKDENDRWCLGFSRKLVDASKESVCPVFGQYVMMTLPSYHGFSESRDFGKDGYRVHHPAFDVAFLPDLEPTKEHVAQVCKTIMGETEAASAAADGPLLSLPIVANADRRRRGRQAKRAKVATATTTTIQGMSVVADSDDDDDDVVVIVEAVSSPSSSASAVSDATDALSAASSVSSPRPAAVASKPKLDDSDEAETAAAAVACETIVKIFGSGEPETGTFAELTSEQAQYKAACLERLELDRVFRAEMEAGFGTWWRNTDPGPSVLDVAAHVTEPMDEQMLDLGDAEFSKQESDALDDLMRKLADVEILDCEFTADELGAFKPDPTCYTTEVAYLLGDIKELPSWTSHNNVWTDVSPITGERIADLPPSHFMQQA